jgi:glyoxylase-like metal-dependent hydrolase (beta-lactamase superfamily II)
MRIHEIQGYIQSIYLVEYKDKLLLLDGCCRCDVKVIREYIETTLRRNIRDLKLVIVSHMHPDHAGAAHVLRKISGCKIATGEYSKHWYGGVRGFFFHLLDIGLTYYVARKLNKPIQWLWYARKLKQDILLSDGDSLSGFEDWTVIKSVGHTDRDIALYHVKTSHIYVADSILKVRSRFISPFPVHHPNQYRVTLNKYLDLKPQKLMMAHGGIVDFDVHAIEKLHVFAPKLPSSTSHFLRRYLYRKLGLRKRGARGKNDH